MDLDPFTITLRFPHPAGKLQDIGATASLIRELGDNYGSYHAFLAQELEATGGRPEPGHYGDDFVAYYRASDHWADIVVAETLLRRCRAFRRSGRGLHEVDAREPTTLDARHRLVSIETGAPTSSALPTGNPSPRYWKRPLSPPER